MLSLVDRKQQLARQETSSRHGGQIEVTFYDLVACSYCDSRNTDMKNAFGPTLCRAICYCNECQQPFEQFKAL